MITAKTVVTPRKRRVLAEKIRNASPNRGRRRFTAAIRPRAPVASMPRKSIRLSRKIAFATEQTTPLSSGVIAWITAPRLTFVSRLDAVSRLIPCATRKSRRLLTSPSASAAYCGSTVINRPTASTRIEPSTTRTPKIASSSTTSARPSGIFLCRSQVCRGWTSSTITRARKTGPISQASRGRPG